MRSRVCSAAAARAELSYCRFLATPIDSTSVSRYSILVNTTRIRTEHGHGRARPPPPRLRRLGRRSCGRVHGDAHALLAVTLELDDAGDLREQREVAADADVVSGVELRADLADENAACGDLLACEALHAAHLR